ncbi:Necrosis inducing protein NPP1 [Phytophthora megakarya]|uniref:Necrosis inducing protein NPP1 n=1 Tax=Phytophthora megakarya TaxID=4795 RepID=A0A225W3T1_9STRA|nr:Necrosis inducing protein NPP1 [Phytophthora megakarya]
MNLIVQVFAVVFLASIQAEEIAFDTVTPFPETKPTTTEYAAALKFKPQFTRRDGCLPFPAVDVEGNTNEGLSPVGFYWTPICSGYNFFDKPSQVYGRAIEYKGVWAIMYAWYFPRDTARIPFYFGHRHGWENVIVWLDSLSKNATISAVSVLGTFDKYSTDTPPKKTTIDGSSLKVEYKSVVGTHHYLKATTSPGRFQDLVMWEDMTEAAIKECNHLGGVSARDV